MTFPLTHHISADFKRQGTSYRYCKSRNKTENKELVLHTNVKKLVIYG